MDLSSTRGNARWIGAWMAAGAMLTLLSGRAAGATTRFGHSAGPQDPMLVVLLLLSGACLLYAGAKFAMQLPGKMSLVKARAAEFRRRQPRIPR